MSLTAVIESLDGVPEQFHELYEERDGQFEITGISGMKTQADVDRLQESLRKERGVSKELRGKVTGFGEHTPETIEELQGQVEDLQLQIEAAKKEGGPSEEDLDKMAESRALMRIKPLERQIAKLQGALEEITGERDKLAANETRTTLVGSVERSAQSKDVGIQKEVLAAGDIALFAERTFEVIDGEVVSREGIPGITPGLSPEQVFLDIKESGSRPYWFGPTVGAGAGGGKGGGQETGDNPFKLDETTGKPKNITAAAQMFRSDPERAKRLAKSAGKGVEKFFPYLFK